MADNLLSRRETKAQAIGAGMSGSDYRTVSRRYADEFKNYGLSGRQARRAGRNMTALMADNDNDTKLGQAQQFQNNLENYMSDVNLDTVAKDPLSRRQALDKSGMNKSLFADRYRGVKNWVRSQNGDLSRRAVRRTARNIMANYNTYFPENTESGISEAGVSAAMNNHAMGRQYSLYPTGTFPTVTPIATRTAATPEVTSTENPPITEDKIVDGHDYTSSGTFGSAFKAARAANLKNFTYKGKSYGTGMATTAGEISAYMKSQGKSDEEINAYLIKKGLKPAEDDSSSSSSSSSSQSPSSGNFTRNAFGDEAVKNAVSSNGITVPNVTVPTFKMPAYYDRKTDTSYLEPRFIDELRADQEYNAASAADRKANNAGGEENKNDPFYDENGNPKLLRDENGKLIYNGGTPMPAMFPEYGALLLGKLFKRRPIARYNPNQISGANHVVPTW